MENIEYRYRQQVIDLLQDALEQAEWQNLSVEVIDELVRNLQSLTEEILEHQETPSQS